MMRMRIYSGLGALAALVVPALTLGAQRPAPRAPVVDTVAAVAPALVRTPPPSTVRPPASAAMSSARQVPTPAVIMPLASPSASPASVAPGRTATMVAPAALMATPVRQVPQQQATAAVTPAQQIAAADGRPAAGMTMRCKDGTFLSGTPSASQCQAHGGLVATFPAARQVPAAPVRKP